MTIQKYKLKKSKEKYWGATIAKLKQGLSEDPHAKMKELFKGKGRGHEDKGH